MFEQRRLDGLGWPLTPGCARTACELGAELKENRRQRDYEEHKQLRYKWYAQQQEARELGAAMGLEYQVDMMDPSIEDCEDDFALAGRAIKELEYQLAPMLRKKRKNMPFGEMIENARTAYDKRLPEDLKERMTAIAQTRNALMHDRDCNALPNRTEFVDEWLAVLSELSLERGRLDAARADFKEVLPRQPGDTFVRTRTRYGTWTDPAGEKRKGYPPGFWTAMAPGPIPYEGEPVTDDAGRPLSRQEMTANAWNYLLGIDDLKAALEMDRMLSDLRNDFEAENGHPPDDAQVNQWRQTLESAKADESAEESGRRQGDKPRQKKPRRRSRRKK